MFFLGYNSALGYKNSGDPVLTNITNITSIKEENCMSDDLYVTRNVDTFSSNMSTTWDFDTILHALYQGTLLAGNVDFIIKSCSAIRIKMREKGKYDWISLYEVPITNTEDLTFERFTSYCKAQTEYEFALIPVINGMEGNLNINSVLSQFDDLFVVDKDNSFYCCDVKVAPVRNRETSTIIPLNSKYPVVVCNNNSNYTTGSVTGLFIKSNDGILDKESMMGYRAKLEDFLFNGYPKIIKYGSGAMWLVQITGNIQDDFDTIGQQGYSKTTFNFTEVGDVEDSNTLYDMGLIDYDPSLN